ncbi:MAG TPA: sigma-70 family RNA polymerase sigma factor [Usitatibacter sp.]|nr:sigma-70 family RNA polymerase sigma factor [Usitatibacter sp.]
MEANRTLDESVQDDDPPRLADVLYARKDRALIPEAEWVALVRAVAGGDQAALHRLYERAHHIAYTLAVRITRDRETAEEVTLDVFHDVWRRASRYDPANGSVLGWIMNQARSRAIDRLRFEHRAKRSDPGDSQEPWSLREAADPRQLVEAEQEAKTLRAALQVLNADEREAIECAFLLGLTHAEVAARLNQPLGTVKTRIRAGLLKLRKAMGREAQAT